LGRPWPASLAHTADCGGCLAPPATHANFEAAADDAVHQERLARDKLEDLVTALAGPAPCCLIVEGVVIALADDADGMAMVREDQVVRI
jgi:hypothetical protein